MPGNGFGGFWFTLGRLSSIENLESKEFYCFSAGCLGLISLLHKRNFTSVLERATSLQDLHKDGQISRYDIVPMFIDFLIPDAATYESQPNLFSNVHIITTKRNDLGFGIVADYRTARSRQDLALLLRQTAWIPAVTGDDLWLDGNMDGAFSIPMHPVCEDVQLSKLPHVEVSKHALNPYLDGELATQFWKDGLALGLL